ncbi:hypothetical protein [Pseudomonas yamanorum]|uniref:DUF5862 family protein n=1 Tax=Pseudomonas yamanorum TaxID=515393 RepID=UPI002ED21362|nr:hypothetical protein VYI69_12190 [Pseudomonas yamanorum]
MKVLNECEIDLVSGAVLDNNGFLGLPSLGSIFSTIGDMVVGAIDSWQTGAIGGGKFGGAGGIGFGALAQLVGWAGSAIVGGIQGAIVTGIKGLKYNDDKMYSFRQTIAGGTRSW